MKKTFVIVVLLFFALNVFSQVESLSNSTPQANVTSVLDTVLPSTTTQSEALPRPMVEKYIPELNGFSVTNVEKGIKVINITNNENSTEVVFQIEGSGTLQAPGNPNAFIIRDLITNKIYNVIRASYPFNESVPENAQIHLFFEKIPAGTERIDVVEGKCTNRCWNMFDIRLEWGKSPEPSIVRCSNERDLQTILNTVNDGETVYIEGQDFSSSKSCSLTGKKNISLVFNEKARVSCTKLYETVLKIVDCDSIQLWNGTFKHENTNQRSCSGPVVDIQGSKNIFLYDCDLNGCGLLGISASNSENIKAIRCRIHDNSAAAYDFANSCKRVSLLSNELSSNGTSGDVTYYEHHYETINDALPENFINVRPLTPMETAVLKEKVETHRPLLTKLDSAVQVLKKVQDSVRMDRYKRNCYSNNAFQLNVKGDFYLVRNSKLYRFATTPQGEWVNVDGSIQSISLDPENPQIIYAITQSGFVHKSMDGGVNWIVIHNGLPDAFTPKRIVVNAQDASVVYLLTTDGVYRTTDAGFTWALFKKGANPTELIMDTSNDRIFYLLENNQLMLSQDAGLTWKDISSALPKEMVPGVGRTAEYRKIPLYTVVLANFPEKKFLLVSTSKGIYQSFDKGATWLLFKELVFLSSYNTGKELYLGSGFVINPVNGKQTLVLGCLGSDGKTWHQKSFDNNQQDVINGICVNMDSNLFISTARGKVAMIDSDNQLVGLNYGVTQNSMTKSISGVTIHGKTIEFAFVDNDQEFEMMGHGLWRSDNDRNWECLHSYSFDQNEATPGMIEVKVSPIDAQEIWSFESGYNFVTFNGGASWEAFGEFTKMGKVQINGFEFDELNKNIVYFSAGGEEPALYRFDKSTKGYTQLRTCGNSFAVSQGKTKKFATSRMEVSMDGGWTWTSFRPKLEEVMNTPEVYLGNASIWVMNYVGNVINLQIYYDSKSYQVVSSDNGQSWTINK